MASLNPLESNWLQEAIAKSQIKKFDYSEFSDIQHLGYGYYGSVSVATGRDGERHALKELFEIPQKADLDQIGEFVNEVGWNIRWCFFLHQRRDTFFYRAIQKLI